MELYNISKDKIDANMAKMQKLLDREKNVLVKTTWPGPWRGFNQVECYHDFEKEFEFYVKNYNMDAEAADEGMDNIPFFRVDFGRVAYLIAIAYGCPVIEVNGLINAKPMITGDVNDAYKLEYIPDIENHGFYPEITRRMRLIQERLGDVGFVVSDTQSPNDVLTEVINSEICMVAMYDDPEPLHYLSDIITRSIEDICRYQGTVVNNLLGYGHDYPLPRGIHLSDDNAAFLSPSTYEEFVLPYNSRLALAFDGVTLHCCMGQKQNIKLMASTPKFQGFDPQVMYNPKEIIMDAITDNGFLRNWTVPEGRDPLDYYKEIIDMTDGKCGLMIDAGAPDKDGALRLGWEVKNYAAKKGRAQ